MTWVSKQTHLLISLFPFIITSFGHVHCWRELKGAYNGWWWWQGLHFGWSIWSQQHERLLAHHQWQGFHFLLIPISSPAFLWSLFCFLWFWFERHVLCMWLIWWVSEKLCTVVQSLDRFESEVHVSLIFLHDTQKIYIWFCWGGFWLYLLINVGSKLIHFEWLAYCGTVKLAFSVLWWLCITNLGARVVLVNNSICIITTMLLCMIGSTFIFLLNLCAYIVSLAHILTG